MEKEYEVEFIWHGGRSIHGVDESVKNLNELVQQYVDEQLSQISQDGELEWTILEGTK